MGLYTREDYENEIKDIDALSATVNRGVLQGVIKGLEVPGYNTQFEQMRRRAWGRLQGTRMILADGDAQRKARLGKPKTKGGMAQPTVIKLSLGRVKA